jgi:ppGpp synthetase/RelA/SpoT-type nucleotidyltranferase
MPDQMEREWLGGQVAAYNRLFPRYRRYARVLEQVLRKQAASVAPLAIVQSRPKAVASFAEKALRKRAEARDPVHDFTDLCGARVICRTPREVEAFSRFVEEHFEIDVEHSVVKGHVDIAWQSRAEATDRLGPSEFGYRSIHYIVSFEEGVDLGVTIPPSVYGLRAEVQIRTTAEHAWADFGHDLSYKGAFELPAKWQRELAIIAAQVEDVDRAFDRIERGLRTYASSYGSYLDEEQLRDEIATLETVLGYDRDNARLAARIGRLAITLGDFKKARDVMSAHVKPRDLASAHQPLLRDLGVALCKLHGNSPTRRDYRRGQRYLEKAVELSDGRDPDAITSLAGTWKPRDAWGGNQHRARDLYRRAFEADPSDAYALGNFLEYEIADAGDTSIVGLLGPAMRAAIERCGAQAEAGVNLPWAFFGTAQFQLLLGEPYDSLRAYAKAVQASTADFMIEGALESLERLAAVRDELAGYDWAHRMLLAGRTVKFRSPTSEEQLQRLAAGSFPPDEHVVIVAGGTHPRLAERMEGYRDLLLEAFPDFSGTIISGGTSQGVSGLVGELCQTYPDVEAVGYLPGRELQPDAKPDSRYGEIRTTDGAGLSPLEPLQNWIDLIASGIAPAKVKVLGIGGGDIAAIEYRIALALGATVGVVEQSGRAASRLLVDEQWVVADNLVPLPEDPETIRAFVGTGSPRLGEDDREAIARAIHEQHRAQAAAETSTDPYRRPWHELADQLKDSSREQADHTFAKLREIGCWVDPVRDREIALMSFTDDEVELMAEMEHGRWNAERLTAGWSWGERKDIQAKTSPYLVPWSELPENVKNWDRKTVREIPRYLAAVGLEVQRKARAGQPGTR